MTPREKAPLEMLFVGGLLVAGGFFMLHLARVAAEQHSLLPSKHSMMSPLQGYAAGGLSLAFGVFICVLWFLRWRRKKHLTGRCS